MRGCKNLMFLSATLGLQVTGRGVSARKAVKKGDVLLFVPDEYMIGLLSTAQ